MHRKAFIYTYKYTPLTAITEDAETGCLGHEYTKERKPLGEWESQKATWRNWASGLGHMSPRTLGVSLSPTPPQTASPVLELLVSPFPLRVLKAAQDAVTEQQQPSSSSPSPRNPPPTQLCLQAQPL